METPTPVAEPTTQRTPTRLAALETCAELIERKTPNFLRVVFNPWVAQTCLVLDHYARQLLRFGSNDAAQFCPSFLANSVDEAISGSVKLARFNATNGSKVLVIDPENRFPHFGYSVREDGSKIEYIPDVERVADAANAHTDADIIVLVGSPDVLTGSLLESRWRDEAVRTIRIVTTSHADSDIKADIVVFDESFVNGEVPLAAFTSRMDLYESWMRGGRSMFHSTTFQPNAIASKHFMTCVRDRDRVTVELLNSTTLGGRPELDDCETDLAATRWVYQQLYSPSLSKLVRTIRFDSLNVRADGHYFEIDRASSDRVVDRSQPVASLPGAIARPLTMRVLDGVAGVACSLRGHNPIGFPDEVRRTIESEPQLTAALADELAQASGLPHYVPAVSGGTAVEIALKLALHAQPERNHVLALKGGFGGKTLFALTGTERPKYKENIGPLYREVTYVDPFAADSIEAIRHVLQTTPIGAVQLELVQGVGGVRPIPQPVVDFLVEQRSQHEYMILVDEVQTGMFRTGPFLRCHDVGLDPDLVTMGKGASDMMFPFAATLFNDRLHKRLDNAGLSFTDWVRSRYDHPIGEAALLNSLRRAKAEDWTTQVRHQADRFEHLLSDGLKSCRNVADIRVFGMLIGIELRKTGMMKLLGKRAGKIYSFAMLQHESPLLMGFCQYEPNIFKLTPGLLMDDAEIEKACRTICDSLKRSPLSVLTGAMKTLLRNKK